MMTKTDTTGPVQCNLFKVLLRDLVDPKHRLVLLCRAIDWKRIEESLEKTYCGNNGRPSVPVRMMAGLTCLKYMFDLSDQEVLDGWVENPYWQYFCGGVFFESEPPTDQSTMSRWRSRAGEGGVTEMLKESIDSAVRNKVAKQRDFKRVNVDTTVQEKNIRFPTDARLLDRARERVIAIGERLGIHFRRTYVRKGKTMLRKHSGYVKAKQFNRASNAARAMKQYLVNVVKDVEDAKFVPKNKREEKIFTKLKGIIDIAYKLIAQDKDTPGSQKVYSVHEPQTECIAKGKVHKRFEFGVKAGLVTASKSNWVLAASALPGNPYDGNSLTKMLTETESNTGVKPKYAYCDLGYRGHDYKGDCDVQVVNRFRKRKVRSVLRWWKRRSAVEPVIGHVKSEHRMDCNRLGGIVGDKINVLLAGLGFNLMKLMKGLARLFLYLDQMPTRFIDVLRVVLASCLQTRHFNHTLNISRCCAVNL